MTCLSNITDMMHVRYRPIWEIFAAHRVHAFGQLNIGRHGQYKSQHGYKVGTDFDLERTAGQSATLMGVVFIYKSQHEVRGSNVSLNFYLKRSNMQPLILM